ncbi:ABC transporter ATP-binding protein [Paenibacillus sp. TRM 82003]|uniref:ABC transporter ATP-binding protein n=1 Tax=Kineococcus sp. TRM81007 TaxID=2925831 RepID=UPI001F60EBFE|nr:ABC transporter ATP-binding protein [Kineococcus sp. TRM81007]MCI3921954.1 ABC transporter ATP-binding protein [Paenibacillus sp. TRM 82003]
MIRARGVRFAHRRRPVLHGVDLDAAAGRVLGVVGPNGSGKTTLLRTLHGSLRPAAGRVEVDGDDVAALSAREVARRVAVVAQEDEGVPPLTVADMVLLGRTPHRGAFSRTSAADEEGAAAALERVGALHLADRPFPELSGGERRRVLVARALTQDAPNLLLDEPTNHLDVRHQHDVLALLRGLGRTVVVVLHDLNLAAAHCDEVVLLDAGRVVAAGTPGEVLTPQRVAAVYGVEARRVEVEDGFQLLLRRSPSAGAGAGLALPVPSTAPTSGPPTGVPLAVPGLLGPRGAHREDR